MLIRALDPGTDVPLVEALYAEAADYWLLADRAPADVQAEWLPRIASGDAVVAMGAIGTPFVLDAAAADLLVLERGDRLFALPTGAATLTPQPSVDGSRRLCSVDWSRSDEIVLAEGADGWHAINAAFDRGALGTAAQLVGLADRMLELTVDYVKQRQQFGVPIGSQQAVKHHLADAAMKLRFAAPAVYAASGQFADQNHRPQEHTRAWLEARNAELAPEERLTPEEIDERARFSMIFGDGRTAVQGSGKKYDLIISEPSNPWLAGVSNLFTKEFFRTAREHLTEDGVLAQWIQTYSFTLADYLMIVRTMHSEFPHFGVLLLANGLDTVLLASNRPLLPTAENLDDVQKMVDDNPEIATDLQRYLGGKDVRALLARYYQLGEEQIKPLLKADPSQLLNTDLHLRLEFDAPLHLFRDLKPNESATAALLNAVDPEWIERLAVAAGVKRDSPEFRAMVAEYYRSIAALRTTQKRENEALAALLELVRLSPNDAAAHAELGQRYLRDQRFAEAVKHFREALRARPDWPLAQIDLAWLLATAREERTRDADEAVVLASQAVNAGNQERAVFLDVLAAAYAAQGRFEAAVKTAEIALQRAEARGENTLSKKIGARLAAYRAGKMDLETPR